MNETEKLTNDGLKQNTNILFRDLIIKRERQKALRANLYMLERKGLQLKQQDILKDASQDTKAAHFAHIRQHLTQSLSVWSRTKKADIIFIRRENRDGALFQTFDKDAVRTAKILKMNAQRMNINNKMVHFVTIPERRMPQVISELSKRDLKTQIVNTQGQNIALTRKRTPAPSVTASVQTQTPKLDVMNTLDKNRQDSRRAAIHVESLNVWADSKGNWKVSGLVNGQTVTAKSIEQADAFNYKTGEMTKEDLALKYNLQEPPKQKTAMTKKNTMTRRYTLDGT